MPPSSKLLQVYDRNRALARPVRRLADMIRLPGLDLPLLAWSGWTLSVRGLPRRSVISEASNERFFRVAVPALHRSVRQGGCLEGRGHEVRRWGRRSEKLRLPADPPPFQTSRSEQLRQPSFLDVTEVENAQNHSSKGFAVGTLFAKSFRFARR